MNNIPQTYNGKSLVHAWTYCAKDGAPLGVVCRYQGLVGKKDIVPFFKPNGSTFSAGIALNPRPLFGLDKLASHPKDRAVFVVEGEKCASAINGLGFCAVTSFGGGLMQRIKQIGRHLMELKKSLLFLIMIFQVKIMLEMYTAN